MASTNTGGSTPVAGQPCPDPSAHQHHSKLSEQASTAALLAVHPDRSHDAPDHEKVNPLGADGKLSSKGAAASLKYAKAQDLPSFPSRGTAADSASKAALLAKDYKMKELWQPELSNAASKASLLAARDGGKVDLWHATPSSAGNSAATIAMRNNGLSPEIDRGYTADGRNKALLAATHSHNQNQRKTAGLVPAPPAPATYPDSQNSVANALNAATISHRNSNKLAPDGWDSEANQAARIKNLGSHMDPKMFGERPPVEIEEEEKRHNAALRASAISMAKQMYDLTQNRPGSSSDLSGGREGAEIAHARQAPAGTTDVKQEAMRYLHLQDAAHKLAQERLAKVDKNLEASRYREYYGYPDESASRKSLNRLSMRGRRNRASSSGTADLDDSSDDEERARRIRGQTSTLTSALSGVDEKKRADDRARLMAAAEKRVHAQLHDMDERVFADTGKVTPAMMEEWEAKARQRAQEEKEAAAANPGKTHIGGGKYIDQSELEAIAQARLKPTLDEINETAEKKRARDEEVRLEKEEQERVKQEQRRQQREEKDEQRRIKSEEKDEQKRVKNEEKAAAKREKEEEKARKEEEKRLAKEEKQKNRESKRESVILGGTAGTAAGASVAESTHTEASPSVQEYTESKPERRSGVFNRLSTKLKRQSKKPDEDIKSFSEAETAAPSAGKDKPHTNTSAALTASGAGAAVAASGAALYDHEEKSDKVDDKKFVSNDAGDTAVENEEPAPTAPDATKLGHSGDHTDAVSSPTMERPRPNLERHITTIETSDEDSDEEPEQPRGLTRPAEEIIATVMSSPVIALTRNDSDGIQQSTAQQSSTAVESEKQQPAALLANIPNQSQPTGPIRDPVSPIVAEPAEQGKTTSQHVTENKTKSTPPAAVADKQNTERISPDISPVEDTSYQASTLPPAAAATTNQSEPVGSVSSGSITGLGKPIAGRGGGVGIAAYDGPSTRGDTGPAPNTIGPHKSDIANILDPRVTPDPSKQKERGTAGPHRSDLLNILDPRVESDPFKAEQKADQVGQDSSKLQKKQPEGASSSGPGTEANSDKKKGLRGLLGKLTNRQSRSDNKLQKSGPESSTDKTAGIDAAEKHVPVATSTTSTTEPVVTSRAPAIAEPPSPSSFRRHADGPDDLDDVSSSGIDEDDLGRGRTGGARPRIDKGKGRETDDSQKVSTSNDDDQFEEARDHFDETLAPPPAFAGQAKSGSPVRGTKFQEVGI